MAARGWPSLRVPRVLPKIANRLKRWPHEEMSCPLMALSIAKRGYVIQTGEVVLADEAAKLMKNAEVQKTYLGVE